MADTSAMILDTQYLNVVCDNVKRAMNAPGGAKPTVFFKFDGIDGESTNDKYKGWCEAYYFSGTVTQPTSTGFTSAMATGTTGRSVLTPYVLAAPVSKATPKFYLGAANGDPIKKLEIAFVIPHGKEQVEYMKLIVEPVTIVGHTLAEPATSGKAMEVIAVIGGKITCKHGQVETNFNFMEAKSN